MVAAPLTTPPVWVPRTRSPNSSDQPTVVNEAISHSADLFSVAPPSDLRNRKLSG